MTYHQELDPRGVIKGCLTEWSGRGLRCSGGISGWNLGEVRGLEMESILC